MLFMHICILNSYDNLRQNQSCQFQMCRFQNPTVLSTSNFSSPFKFKLMQSCQINFNLVLRYNLLLLSVKWLVHIQEQLVPVNLSLLSVKWLVRIQEQLVPVNLFPSLSSVEPLVRIQEQLVPVLCFLQPSDQFKYKNSLCFLLFFQPSNQLKYESSLRPFTCQYSRSSSQFEPKEQLAPVNLLLSLPSESCYSSSC